MQNEIVNAIAAYLDENTFLNDADVYAPEITFGIVKEYPTPTHSECCKNLAEEIAAAIAPLVEAGEVDWKDAPEWANYTTTFDGKRYFFEDIFYPCRFIRGDSKTIWKGDFETQAKNASWDGTIERRPQ